MSSETLVELTVLRIQCFGQFAVRRGEEPVGGSASQPRRLAVLALLARAGTRGLPRDTVLRLLWPDEEEEKGRKVLSQAVYMLKRDLGSEEVIEGGRVLTLNALEITSDVFQFERAVAERRYDDAVRVYEGAFLDGFSLPGATEFNRWADDSRDALALTFADAAERAASDAMARGEFAEAVALWRKRANADPLDEQIAVKLMEALEANGERAASIKHAAIFTALAQQEDASANAHAVQAFADLLRAKGARTVALPDVAAATPTQQTTAVDAPGIVSRPAIADAVAEQASALPEASTQIHTDARLTRTEQHRVKRAWRRGAIASIAAVAAVAAIALSLYTWRYRAPKFDEHRVLVTPLLNLSGDASLDSYGLMAAEWIAQGLSNSGLVQVVDARSMAEIMRDVPSTDAPETDTSVDGARAIAARLGAGIVISGSVYKSGDSLLMQVKIVNPHTGELRKSIAPMGVSVANATSALEPLRERVTGALAVILETRLPHTGATGSAPPTFEAYAEYLKAIQAFGRDNPTALVHFRNASRIDSSFLQARMWSAMAMANTRRYAEAESTFRLIDREKLPPYDQANYDYFRSGFMDGDWETSFKSANRMLELAPHAGHAHYAVGLTSIFTLRVQQGIDMMGTINLTHGFGEEWAPRIIFLRLRGYETLGEYREALLLGKQLREANPTMGWQRVPELKILARTHAGTNGSPLFTRRLQEAMALPASNIGWETFDPGDMLHQVALSAKFVGDSLLADSLWGVARKWYSERTPSELATPFVKRGRARVLYASRDVDGSLALYRELDASAAGIPEDRAMLGVIAIQKGDTSSAREIARALEADTASYRFGQPRAWAARIAALLNQPDWVAQLLHRARREGYTRQWEAQVDPAFSHLRKLESFKDAMAPFITDGTQDRTSLPRS